MDVNNKRVLVVGLGKSGVASALFLKKHGARVSVSDSKTEDQFREEIPVLLDHGISVETGGHGERTFRGQDLIVVSPGVPVDAVPLVQARSLGETVIGEIELAAQFLQGTIVAITGSNGKTTTTTLAGQILAAGGFPIVVGGNIGTPAISLVEHTKPETLVALEVSSFQLETIRTFRPEVAVVLNVTPDHLDRHRTFEAYVNAKARIFENQQASDFAVLNADDPTCVEMAKRTKAQVFWFTRKKKEVAQGAWVRNGRFAFRSQERESDILAISEMPLKGAHNVENVLAAISVGMLMGCKPEQIAKAVREFKAVEHRLEYVATIRGVEYYNDSKATNVDATIKALESFPANIHIILGGKDKGSDYTVLNDLLRQRVKRVYTIGAAAAKIESQIRGAEVIHAETLDSAVKRAAASAKAGDIVLLAPACASFDQFQNYEHRGRVFKQAVHGLGEQARKEQAVRGDA